MSKPKGDRSRSYEIQEAVLVVMRINNELLRLIDQEANIMPYERQLIAKRKVWLVNERARFERIAKGKTQ